MQMLQALCSTSTLADTFEASVSLIAKASICCAQCLADYVLPTKNHSVCVAAQLRHCWISVIILWFQIVPNEQNLRHSCMK